METSVYLAACRLFLPQVLKVRAIHLSTQSLQCLQQYATKIDRFQDLKRPKIGRCQENDTRSGRRFACRLYPSHGPLRFITSHSFRARLCHAKNEAPEEEAAADRCLCIIKQFSDVRFLLRLILYFLKGNLGQKFTPKFN